MLHIVQVYRSSARDLPDRTMISPHSNTNCLREPSLEATGRLFFFKARISYS